MNKSLLLVPMGLSALGAQAKAKPAAGCDKPLNIIYIMTDDHSFQTISCYDGRYNNTPNLDRLAREGVRFDNSFVANMIAGILNPMLTLFKNINYVSVCIVGGCYYMGRWFGTGKVITKTLGLGSIEAFLSYSSMFSTHN